MQLTAEQIETIAKVIDDNTIEEKLLSGYITSPNGIAASLAWQLSQNGVEYVGKLNSDKFTISASSSSIGEGSSVTINVSGVSTSMLNFEVDSVLVTDGGVTPDYVKALCSFDGNVLHVAKGSNVNGWKANVIVKATPKFTSPDTATARIEVKGRIIPTGINVDGPSEIVVENGEGYADYIISYTPSSFDGDASVNVIVGGEYAQFVTPSNISRNGFRLSTTASKFTADITVEVIVEGVRLTKTFSVEFQKVVAPAPFIIHNPTSSAIAITLVANGTMYDVDVAIVNDYQVGKADDGSYDFEFVNWEHNNKQYDERYSIPAGCSLFIKSDTMERWYISSSTRVGFSIQTKGLVFDGDIMALLKDRKMTQSYALGGLFSNCKGIVTAPKLPAMSLYQSCYFQMFSGCTNLVNAPELPATSLAQSCYGRMFEGCTSLTDAPELKAPLMSSCYYYMFSGCTSLVNAPKLENTIMRSMCYEGMFANCTSLVTAPELNSMWLEDYCYRSMFRGCTSLVNAPELPAANLKTQCYNYMFNGCTKLNHVKAMFTTTPSTSYTREWLYGVSPTGTYVMNAAATWNPESYRTPSGIPEGWTLLTATN